MRRGMSSMSSCMEKFSASWPHASSDMNRDFIARNISPALRRYACADCFILFRNPLCSSSFEARALENGLFIWGLTLLTAWVAVFIL
jgi:hypothetical protein